MPIADCPSPVLGFVAYSGTGKTTLLERLLPLLHTAGLRIAVIKHAHHDFDIDIPGKDSYRLRHAGAQQMLVASRQRWALITEQSEHGDEPDLGRLLQELDHAHLDLVLVEGFKHENFDKVELHRASLGKPLLCRDDRTIIAVASDAPLDPDTPAQRLDLNDPQALLSFILDYCRTRGT